MREQQLYDGAYLARRGSVPVEVTMTGDEERLQRQRQGDWNVYGTSD